MRFNHRLMAASNIFSDEINPGLNSFFSFYVINPIRTNHTDLEQKSKRGGCSGEHPPPPEISWGGKPPGVVSLREAEMASKDARFLPEERNYTLIDALGLAQSCDTSLLHHLESSHLCSLMGVVSVHDLAGCSAEALDIVGHVAD